MPASDDIFPASELPGNGVLHRKAALLDESAERLRFVGEKSLVGYWHWDIGPDLLEWSAQCKRLFAIPETAELTYARFLAAVHPLDRERVDQAVHACLEGGGRLPYSLEYRVLWPDGAVRWLHAKGDATFAGGQPVRMAGIAMDITERKEAEAKLSASEARYRELAEAVPAMLWTADPAGVTTDHNRRWFEFTGQTPEQARGDGWRDIIHPDDFPCVSEAWNRCVQTGEAYAIEYRIRRAADQIYRWHSVQARLRRDEAGQPLGWFGTCVDIHDLKCAEAALKAAKEEAESANKTKDRFLAQLSHELRTPLAPVLMIVESLLEAANLPPEVLRQLSVIQRSVALEVRLLDDLFDISTILKGKLRLLREPIDVHNVIALAVEIVREKAGAKQIHLHCEPAASHTLLTADSARIQQVIWNLLLNAIKFTPAGGRVTLRTTNVADATGGCRLRIEISDTGIGLETEALERIFHPFEQVRRNQAHGEEGLGLGLAIAQSIVKLHGGNLRAHSAGLNRGATFIIELPGAAPMNTAAESGASPALAAAPPPATGAHRLLLVEDHASTLEVVAALLRRTGYHVVTAACVADALKAAAKHPFDLVVSDLGLPDGTGVELMEKLRAAHGLRGLAMSGYGMDEEITRARQAGFVAHLVKPVQIAELRKALDALL